jgi:Na+-translocating ferredoxin:NAD+ oxidoreductase subunit G
MSAPDPSSPLPTPPASSLRISLRTAVILLLFTLAFTALMAGIYRLTEPTIAASAEAERLRLIGEVLPPALYDNKLLDDAVALPELPALGIEAGTRLYRARKGSAPVALVFEAAAPDGYSGRVGLLLAVAPDGRLLAMRVTQHKETPGLGDYVDPKKDKNKQQPWIAQFEGASVDAVRDGQWKVKKDGGRFDARAGATISARAVTNASGRALAWVHPRSAKLFALPTGQSYREAGT